MEPLPESATPGWPFPFTPQDWAQPPPAVQASLRTVRDALGQLQERVDTLEARLQQHSTTSHRPPSSDSPSKQPRQRPSPTTPQKAGGKLGHPGHRQALVPPTTLQARRPERGACGPTAFALPTPYHTHQVLELPPIALEVTHGVLHQGWCPDGGRWSKAQVPPEHATGYGPRLSALMGARAGASGNGRRIVQTCCASVLHVPISVGAMQKVLDRVSQAIAPPSLALATPTRHAPVNYLDETPWFLTHTLQWLWVMVRDTAARYMIQPHRSQAALAARIDDGAGILVSDGYGVYQNWVQARHTCWAHLIRSARGVAARAQPALAACGTWALAELPRLCHLATAPPTGGEWRAWDARLCQLIDPYHDRSDEAGRFARRLLREMDSLWGFVAPHGVEPTKNRAERALRCGVLWRQRSLGTASTKGNHWVERILSLRETCRLQARSTSMVLGDAVASLFQGQQPDLSGIGQR